MDDFALFAPVSLGALLLAACSIVIIFRKDTPSILAGFLLVGALLAVAPQLKELVFEGWGLKINLAKGIKDTTNDLASSIAELRAQVGELQKKGGGEITVSSQSKPSILISYAQARKDTGKKLETELLKKGLAAIAVYDDLTQVQNKFPSGDNSMVYTKEQAATASTVRNSIKNIFPDFKFSQESEVNSLSAAPIQIRLF